MRSLTPSRLRGPLSATTLHLLLTLALAASGCGDDAGGSSGADDGSSSDGAGGTGGSGSTSITGGGAGGGSGSGGSDGSGPVQGVEPGFFTRVGDQVFFVGFDDLGYTDSLWITDGTAAGTRLVVEMNVRADPTAFVALGDKLLFADQMSGVWVSDGTPEGTVLLADVVLGVGFIVVDGHAFFMASDAEHGQEHWVTDGTPAGTRMLRDLNPGPGDTLAVYDALTTPRQDHVVVDGKFYFLANEEGQGAQLYVSDGTDAGTRRLTPAIGYLVAGGLDYDLVAYEGRIYFTYHSPDHGTELWWTDGTPEGTELFADLLAGPNAMAWPSDFHEIGERLVFSGLAADGNGALGAIWTSDGTVEGTREIAPLSHAATEQEMWHVGDRLVFSAFSRNADPGVTTLHTTDGLTVEPLADVVAYSELVPLGDGRYVFFAGESTSLDFEPWVTDGTPAGTTRIADLNPGPAGSHIRAAYGYIGGNADYPSLAVLDGKAYFPAYVGEGDLRLFGTDGVVVEEVVPPGATRTEATATPYPPFVHEGALLVSAAFDESGFALWRIEP